MQLCGKYHISPFEIRRERFSEFCLLVKRLKKQGENKENKLTTQTTDGKKKRNFIPVTDYKEPKRQGGDLNG
jgi:hypothetical protein